ncbi:MAG: GcrA cell cycle regulator [Hyphomicrobiales bacterium]|nr:GcrA cell cycle regulator [Hyphomicrobiales bacterium]
MSWTEERIETLRTMWAARHSAKTIAGVLGEGVTRNAVIGKIHRLGLSERTKADEEGLVKAKPAPMARKAQHAMPTIQGNTVLAPIAEVQAQTLPQTHVRLVESVVVPMCESISIMELRETTCRWPLGDPMTADFSYCGAKSPFGGGPYCAAHARIAYQPAQERRRERSARQAQG